MNQRTALPPPFPEDWTKAPLGSIADIRTGDKDNQDKQSHGKYPFFVRSPHVERINSYSYDGEAILVPGEGNIGEIFHYVNGRFDFHQRVYKISHFPPDVHGRFLYHYLSHFFGRHALRNSVKATVDSLRRPTFETFEVYLPEMSEQKRIASALDDCGRLVESLDELVEKKQHVAEGVRTQLLTSASRLPGFSGPWEMKRLNELGGSFLKGGSISKRDLTDHGMPCVLYGEIYTRHHHWIRDFVSHIPNELASSAVKLESGDLLFTGSGETADEIGKCVAYVGSDEAAYAGGDIVILRNAGINPRFGGYALNTSKVQAQKSRLGQGATVSHISPNHLAHLELQMPPSREEQEAIAEVLSDMDAEIDALVAQREKTAQLKQAMMQELLTGRTRLS